MRSEIYSGIKYKVNFISRNIPEDARLEELKLWCRKFHEYNLAPPYPGGSAGNLSFRLSPGQLPFIITGTAMGLKDSPDNSKFVRVESCDVLAKEVNVHGVIEPSSETMLHYSIYKQRPDVEAIFHGHSDEIIAATDALHIPQTKTAEPYGSIQLIHSALEILADYSFIMLRSHGFVSMGNSMKQTGDLAIEKLLKAKPRV